MLLIKERDSLLRFEMFWGLGCFSPLLKTSTKGLWELQTKKKGLYMGIGYILTAANLMITTILRNKSIIETEEENRKGHLPHIHIPPKN